MSEYYEIIGFSDIDNNSDDVVIIIAANLTQEEIDKNPLRITRVMNKIIVDYNNGEQVHTGVPESPNQFNWKRAQVASLDNDLTLTYSQACGIEEI